MELTIEQLDRLIKLKPRKSYADLAASELGDRSLGPMLRSALRRYIKTIPVDLPNPALANIPAALTLPADDVLIIADLHAPFQNTALLKQAIVLAKAANIKYIDIAGDLHDFNSLSSYAKHETFSNAETDIAHARQILMSLSQSFESIAIVSGNHDEYWIKKRGGSFEDLIYQEVLQGKLSSQVKATNYDYLLRDDWIIGHISNYDETPGLIAARIADYAQKHVAVGHDHVRGHKHTASQHIGISIGAMLTPDRFWYKVRRLTPFPPFQLGFLMLINGKPYHFSDSGNTNLNGDFHTFDYWETYFKDGRQYE